MSSFFPTKAPISAISLLLPEEARNTLIRASKAPEADRAASVDSAIDEVKRHYPQFFKGAANVNR